MEIVFAISTKIFSNISELLNIMLSSSFHPPNRDSKFNVIIKANKLHIPIRIENTNNIIKLFLKNVTAERIDNTTETIHIISI